MLLHKYLGKLNCGIKYWDTNGKKLPNKFFKIIFMAKQWSEKMKNKYRQSGLVDFHAVIFIILMFSTSCGSNDSEKEALKYSFDSLSLVMNEQRKVLQVMEDVGFMLDSIDSSRENIFLSMETGISTREDFKDRMSELNEYVVKAEQTIDELRNELDKSGVNNRLLFSQLNKLKSELEQRNQQIIALESQVEEYKAQNTNLVDLTKAQLRKLKEMDNALVNKAAELEMIQSQIIALNQKSQISAADSYYARGIAIVLAAERTKLAPKKKRETLEEALVLFEKSLELGKKEALDKIEEIKKKL
jgi:chromosome segregation ATPase